MNYQTPDFIVVGAGKSGTSWLSACLLEHPDIFVPHTGEVHYFSTHYSREPDWYLSHFENVRGELVVGESSPTYLWWPEVPLRIKNWNPDMRLIFILREPVSRAYSEYCMHLSVEKVSSEIDKVLVPDSEYVTSGLYYRHITSYLEYFPDSQMKILLYDDLENDPKIFLEEICNYLGVDTTFKPTVLDKVFFGRKPRKRFAKTHMLLIGLASAIQKRSTYIAAGMQKLRSSPITSSYHRMMAGNDYPELSQVTRDQLAEFYREDIDALSRLINRDLSHWHSARV